jgi:hypothetical protein
MILGVSFFLGTSFFGQAKKKCLAVQDEIINRI